MAKKFYLSVITASLILIFSSCKKEGHGNTRMVGQPDNTVLEISITAGETYRLPLGQYGAGTASISKQATAYLVSQIIPDGLSGGYAYTYSGNGSPKTGETLKDQVTLKITNTERSNGGCRNNNNEHASEKNITINFTVN